MNTASPSQNKGLAITSLIFGIIAIFTALVAPIAIVCSLVAIIFGIISLKNSRGLATAGLVTGILGLVASIFWLLILGAVLKS